MDIREIRANRIGITFENQFQRDPFQFVATPSLLLQMLYKLTRPGTATPKQKLQRIEIVAPTRTFVARRGERWGNDSIED